MIRMVDSKAYNHEFSTNPDVLFCLAPHSDCSILRKGVARGWADRWAVFNTCMKKWCKVSSTNRNAKMGFVFPKADCDPQCGPCFNGGNTNDEMKMHTLFWTLNAVRHSFPHCYTTTQSKEAQSKRNSWTPGSTRAGHNNTRSKTCASNMRPQLPVQERENGGRETFKDRPEHISF